MPNEIKIYFCGSIRGGRQDADLYARLIEHLKTYGPVLTEHVGSVNDLGDDLPPEEIHRRDNKWMEETDVVVAEVTQPSLGVGYEIAKAETLNKPILCLFRPASGKGLSGLIDGCKNDKNFFVEHYEEKDAHAIIKRFISKFHDVNE